MQEQQSDEIEAEQKRAKENELNRGQRAVQTDIGGFVRQQRDRRSVEEVQ